MPACQRDTTRDNTNHVSVSAWQPRPEPALASEPPPAPSPEPEPAPQLALERPPELAPEPAPADLPRSLYYVVEVDFFVHPFVDHRRFFSHAKFQ